MEAGPIEEGACHCQLPPNESNRSRRGMVGAPAQPSEPSGPTMTSCCRAPSATLLPFTSRLTGRLPHPCVLNEAFFGGGIVS